MISPVSFRSTADSAARFHEMVSRPQAFVAQTTAVASTPVEDKPKNKGGFIKKLLIGAGIVAAAIAAISLATKKGFFKVTNPEEGNKAVNAVKSGLNKVGTTVTDFVSKHAENIKNAAQDVAKEAPKA